MLWYLGAKTEEEYLLAKAQFEKNIQALEQGLGYLKTQERSWRFPTLGMAAAAIAISVLAYKMIEQF